MTNYKKKLVIGTRTSRLALAQTKLFIDKLLLAYPDMSHDSVKICPIKTSGDQNQSIRLDQMGGKGLFAKEIETELLKETLDLAIHSMKDIPVEMNNELSIGCWLERYDHRDALLCNENIKSISHLSKNSLIGTSSISSPPYFGTNRTSGLSSLTISFKAEIISSISIIILLFFHQFHSSNLSCKHLNQMETKQIQVLLATKYYP